MSKIYTGVGARATPPNVCSKIIIIAQKLAQKGYTLRSGAAASADESFEKGCDLARGEKEIYLPWKGFNKSSSNLYRIPDKAFDIAAELHPNWKNLKQGAKKLMARNVLQVLGLDLDNPSDFLICYTLGGECIGGTAMAINLAEKHGVSVYNLFNKEDQLKVKSIIEK